MLKVEFHRFAALLLFHLFYVDRYDKKRISISDVNTLFICCLDYPLKDY